MKQDCNMCMSAGSVNRWGYCEVCGEDMESAEARVTWGVRSEVKAGAEFRVAGASAAGMSKVGIKAREQRRRLNVA